MTDDAEDTNTEESVEISKFATAPVSSTYKVLGQFDAPSGTAVLGQNDANSGSPVGVEGATPNASGGYGLSTPDDARIEGRVVSTSTHETWVGARRQLRLDPYADDYQGNTAAGNVLGGFGFADDGTVGAAMGNGGSLGNGNEIYDDYDTIGGGDGNLAGVAGTGFGASGTGNAVYATIGGGLNNTAAAEHATVGGGRNNATSGQKSFIGGGRDNEVAQSRSATIAGGQNNFAWGNRTAIAGGRDNFGLGYDSAIGGGEKNRTGASGGTVNYYCTVPGGFKSVAEAETTFAAGHKAKALDNYAFVWADKAGDDFQGSPFRSDQDDVNSTTPTGSNTFQVRATGGVRFVTSVDTNSNDKPDSGSYLASGGSSWQSFSAASVKHDVRPVDPQSVLDGVDSLSISRWAYDARPGVDRMGPMAGEFHDAFELGDDPETIGHVDADGVALAAIQGLSERLDETRAELDDANAELADKDERIDSLESENDRLRERVAAIEDRLGMDD